MGGREPCDHLFTDISAECDLYPSTGDTAMEKQQPNLYRMDSQFGGKVDGSGAYKNNITVIVIYTIY